MSADPGLVDRVDRLPAIRVARAILREVFGLELVVLGPRGAAAHARGGVMASSTEACRAALFSREGFARCDAFYRARGCGEGPGDGEGAVGGRDANVDGHACHLGLACVDEPVSVEGVVVARVAASGFEAPDLRLPRLDRAALAEALRALDPGLQDPAALVATVPSLRRDRVALVRAVLRTAARETQAHEEERRARLATVEGGLPGRFGLVGASFRMQEVFEQVPQMAASHATVLVSGESGTGKELLARALWTQGPRAGRPFVAQSCGSMSDELLESTLFGHVRGAFSGALHPSPGLFGAAEGGTLFLDEVGEMSPSMQVKLLRVLQDGSYLPVGATGARKADVRVIAATHRDLRAMVRAGTFREDLFYRLHVLPIRLPPLRERTGDLRLLVRAFLAELSPAPRRVGEAAWACLERYAWPGNVRELRAEVERWTVHASEAAELGPEHLSSALREAGGYAGAMGGEAAVAAATGAGTLAEAVEALERALIGRGLERTAGNKTLLAKELGISRTTLGQRLRRFGMDDED